MYLPFLCGEVVLSKEVGVVPPRLQASPCNNQRAHVQDEAEDVAHMLWGRGKFGQDGVRGLIILFYYTVQVLMAETKGTYIGAH